VVLGERKLYVCKCGGEFWGQEEGGVDIGWGCEWGDHPSWFPPCPVSGEPTYNGNDEDGSCGRQQHTIHWIHSGQSLVPQGSKS
jgi:hypothetical protein